MSKHLEVPPLGELHRSHPYVKSLLAKAHRERAEAVHALLRQVFRLPGWLSRPVQARGPAPCDA